jgi:acetylornithine deacetylase/succinyl-diaminopimelate desuccinylase-like protein
MRICQAVFADQWQTPPFTPTLRTKDAEGRWQTLPLEKLSGPLDPEWRLFARSSADDKAPIIMLMAAMDALRARAKARHQREDHHRF